MRMAGRQTRRGVSLLETILAASLLGGAIMTVCSLAAGSLRSVRLNQEYEKAWDYIERQLVLIDMIGADAFLKSGKTGGQFESLDGRTWRWNVAIVQSPITSLYEVSIIVEWEGSGRLRRVECRTRLCGKEIMTDQETTEDTSQTSQGTTTQGTTSGQGTVTQGATR